MKARLRALAKKDLREAIEWYAERSPHVATQFGAEVSRAIQHLEQFPSAGGVIPGVADPDVRSLPVHNFPYRLVFMRLGNRISVLAIAHYRRRPGYWRR